MSGQVLQLRTHHEAESLLPWFVNGTLDDEERRQVAQHLEDCAHCRSEMKKPTRNRSTNVTCHS